MISLKNGKGEVILPISAMNIACILQHCGVTPQYNGIDDLGNIYSSINTDETIRFIAITK
jgi:glutathione peroxidase-family protein